MDPKHAGDIFKHLEKQNELLTDAYKSMSDELHRLQVEEEMLMRKYYEFMAAEGVIEKEKCSGTNVTEDKEKDHAGEDKEKDQAGELVSMTREE